MDKSNLIIIKLGMRRFLNPNDRFSYPKNPKMCDPILVTVLKKQPHYSQSSRKNATPSSGTSPAAYYLEVPPPPRATELPFSVLFSIEIQWRIVCQLIQYFFYPKKDELTCFTFQFKMIIQWQISVKTIPTR